MLTLLMVALLQAAAGEPQMPSATAPVEAPAAAAAPINVATAAQPATPAPVMRCRREQVTGTRLTQRVCTTGAQDANMAQDGRDFTNRFQSQLPNEKSN